MSLQTIFGLEMSTILFNIGNHSVFQSSKRIIQTSARASGGNGLEKNLALLNIQTSETQGFLTLEKK